ncbi:RDD family protein [Ramlibacter sp. PS4R-6]|uniref:RDD family protein n=1 Tax=Ramlibacter sp. PS4R-6 TaxID=3133438 RepID=UPI0030B3D6FE
MRRRLASLLYEALVGLAVVLVAVALFSLVTTFAPALPHQRPLLLASCFVTLGGYFIYCWRHGQTLAMRAWQLKIVDGAGHPPAMGRACLRFVLGWVWVAPPLALAALARPHAASLGAGLALGCGAVLAWVVVWSFACVLRKDRQFWHDVLAGTRIVMA